MASHGHGAAGNSEHPYPPIHFDNYLEYFDDLDGLELYTVPPQLPSTAPTPYHSLNHLQNLPPSRPTTSPEYLGYDPSWNPFHPWRKRPVRLNEAPGGWNMGQIDSLKRNPRLLSAAQRTSGLQLVQGNVIITGRKPVAIGSYGSVWEGLQFVQEAQSRGLSATKVAVKVVNVLGEDNDRLLKRVFREVVPLCDLQSHPNVLPVRGYLLRGNSGWVISEWQERGSAFENLHRNCVTDKMKLISDIVAGLAFLHSCNPPIVHGDLKPDNVLIGANATAMLTDFGLARILDDTLGLVFTTSSVFRGCIYYISPELLAGSMRTKESDIWALGCLILQIASDKLPWNGKNKREILAALYLGNPPDIRAYQPFPDDARLLPIIEGCLRLNPAERLTATQIEAFLR
ncbi:hypothetical protein FRC03_000191 [Tulasnella sp. 419]|nr:hypothetical protein FRC03_000191 [Tulasnella sp. 419]